MTETTNIIYDQPIETKVHIGNKTNAKGELQPEIEITITRKLKDKEDIYKIITDDVEEAVKKVKENLEKLK